LAKQSLNQTSTSMYREHDGSTVGDDLALTALGESFIHT
jgi:hypothetical protein